MHCTDLWKSSQLTAPEWGAPPSVEEVHVALQHCPLAATTWPSTPALDADSLHSDAHVTRTPVPASCFPASDARTHSTSSYFDAPSASAYRTLYSAPLSTSADREMPCPCTVVQQWYCRLTMPLAAWSPL